MSIFPFGLVVGFTITALPFLLTNLGIPLYQVAGVSATVMSPTFWGFLLQPIMDTGLTRRAYSWLNGDQFGNLPGGGTPIDLARTSGSGNRTAHAG